MTSDTLSDFDVAQLRLALGFRAAKPCPDCGSDISRLHALAQRCVSCSIARQRSAEAERNVARRIARHALGAPP